MHQCQEWKEPCRMLKYLDLKDRVFSVHQTSLDIFLSDPYAETRT